VTAPRLAELWLDLDVLSDTSYTSVAELARFVAYTTLRDAPAGERWASPIWYLGPSSSVARVEHAWPSIFRELYWRGEPARVLSEASTVTAIVDAVAKHRRAPVSLVERVRRTSALWASEEPARSTGRPYMPPAHVLSRMLAHVGHAVAAGLSHDELRASLGADRDEVLSARAEEKLEAFEATIDRWWEEHAR
jgi:hypothetical protein